MIDNHKIFKTHKILKAICFLNRKIDNFNNFYFPKASFENISNIIIYNLFKKFNESLLLKLIINK
jgi:hypothetical protein